MRKLLVLAVLACMWGAAVGEADDAPVKPAMPAAAADPNNQAELNSALDEYNTVVRAQVERVAQAINEAFRRASGKGDLNLARKAQDAEDHLRENGEPPQGDFMRSIRDEAQRNITRAAKKLEARYNAVAKSILKSGDVEGAESVVAEAKEITQASQNWRERTRAPVPGESAPGDGKTATRESKSGVTFTNSIGMKFMSIATGSFLMGDARGTPDEVPHQVTITKPYYIGVYEVTNAQWIQVMKHLPSKQKDADLPVESVTWEEVSQFCQQLSQLPAERLARRVYRLPTEAEWEYACRAGTTTRYSFGDDESRLRDVAWFGENSAGRTHPIGQKPPNAWGLYDMHGNVWEWVQDWQAPFQAKPVVDPLGPSEGTWKARRGGGWDTSAWDSRSAFRGKAIVTARHEFQGFRVAVSR